MAEFELKNITKKYGNGTIALHNINLRIAQGELVAVTGMPDSGKSTLLRIIAGLEKQTEGEILIDGKPAPPDIRARDAAMIFQHYGLRPNLTVYANLALGLKLRKTDKEEIDVRVREAAAQLGLTAMLNKKPKKITELQRRRAMLARALVRRPEIFLLDEPLGTLKGRARTALRTDILNVHKQLKTTFICAAADFSEALSCAERVVLLDCGEIAGYDAPQSLYDNPPNQFAAAYFGAPRINLFKCMLTRESGKMYAALDAHKILIPPARARRLFDEAYIGKEVVLGVRPENFHAEEVFLAGSPDTVIDAHIENVERLGHETILHIRVAGSKDDATARVCARQTAVAGDTIKLALDGNRIHFFDPETGHSITGVPHTNRIFAEVEKTENGSRLAFGDTKALIAAPLVAGNVRLEIDPQFLIEKKAFDAMQLARLEKGEPPFEDEYFEIQGKLEFAEKHALFTALFVSVAGKRGLVVALCPPETVCAGGDITLLAQASKIRLYAIG
ncbi:MAG: ABC transporter ATP-binding protein [Firmicutes bacterium]|nr:ABC transporter ATP-binding protein [Bacillota bacterium]